MKSKRDILFFIILFATAVLCFESNNHAFCDFPCYNVENTADSNGCKNISCSNCELYDYNKVNYNNDICFYVENRFKVSETGVPTSTYVVSVWQPPEIS